MTALEQRARLDPNRLPRGRSYARGGTVGELAIAPGEVRAAVQGRRVRPYQVRVRVRVLDADRVGPGPGRDRRPDRARRGPARRGAAARGGRRRAQRGHRPAARPGRAAAALLLPRLGRPVQARRGGLLPGGRCAGRRPVLAAAAAWPPARRGAGRPPRPPPLRRGDHGPPDRSRPATDPGVDAREAYRRSLAPLPAPPLPPQRPGQPAVLPVDPPPAPACGRRTWWRWPPTPQPAPSSWRPDPATVACRSTSRPTWPAAPPGCWEPDVAWPRWPRRPACPRGSCCAWAVTWQHAGRGGLDALRTTWQPAATDLAEGRAALDRLAGQGAVRAWRNRLTRGGLQLRLGGDGQWYRFVRSGGDWAQDWSASPSQSRMAKDALR